MASGLVPSSVDIVMALGSEAFHCSENRLSDCEPGCGSTRYGLMRQSTGTVWAPQTDMVNGSFQTIFGNPVKSTAKPLIWDKLLLQPIVRYRALQ